MDGTVLLCRKISSHHLFGKARPKVDKTGSPYYVFRLAERPTGRGAWPVLEPEPADEPPDLTEVATQYAANFTREHGDRLAAHLILPRWAVDALPGIGVKQSVRYKGDKLDGWTFPEVDANGRVVGIAFRSYTGVKLSEKGGSRGLTIPAAFSLGGASPGPHTPRDHPDPLFVVEGASDVLALSAAGLSAVGRPSNVGGVNYLAAQLSGVPVGRPIVVVGENDRKEDSAAKDGSWPGRAGAYLTAAALAAKLNRPVCWSMTPELKNGSHKDAREWLVAKAGGSRRKDRWRNLGGELRTAVLATQVAVGPDHPCCPQPVMEARCRTPSRPRLAGRPGEARDGVRATLWVRCRCWRCEDCRAGQRNRVGSWLYSCVLQWCDPARLPAAIPPIEGAPDATRFGPWQLYAAVLPAKKWQSVRASLNVHNYENIRRAEYCKVSVRISLAAHGPTPFSLIHSPEVFGKMRDAVFVLVAVSHELDPPRVLKPQPVSSDEAMCLLDEAFNHIPPPPPAGDKRFVPVTFSRGWRVRSTEEEERSSLWEYEGRSGLRAADSQWLVAQLKAEAGIIVAPKNKDKQADVAWLDDALGGELGSWAFGRMQDVKLIDRQYDTSDILARFRLWRPILKDAYKRHLLLHPPELAFDADGMVTRFAHDPDGRFGPELVGYLDRHLGGDPPDGVLDALSTALLSDYETATNRAEMKAIAKAIKQGEIDLPAFGIAARKKKERKRRIDHTKTEIGRQIRSTIGR